ncbi:MAG: 23S rRNA (pseudouridine(1915)-N(3))-methyltransferase RlmH, partial [Bacteroidia bacterium]
LDENGKSYRSVDFASQIERWSVQGIDTLVFVIGGAYGFSEEVYERSNAKMSLSPMTFSHQMVRLIFLEQLYRACSINKGEPYHHE